MTLSAAVTALTEAKQIPRGSPFEEKTVSLRSGAIAAAGVLAIAALVVAFRSASHTGDKAEAAPAAAAGAAPSSPLPNTHPGAATGVWSAVVAPFLALPWLRDSDPAPGGAASAPQTGGATEGQAGGASPLAWLWGGAADPPASDVACSQPVGHPPSMLRPASLPDLPNTITVRGPSALQRLSSARTPTSISTREGRGALVHAATALAAAAAAGVRVSSGGGGSGQQGGAAQPAALLSHPSRTARFVFPFIDQRSGRAFVPALRSQGYVSLAGAAAAGARAHHGAKAGATSRAAGMELMYALLCLALEQELLWLPLMVSCGADRGLGEATPLAPPGGADPPNCEDHDPNTGIDTEVGSAAILQAAVASDRPRRSIVSGGVAARLPPPYRAAAGPGDCESNGVNRVGAYVGFGSCAVCLEPFVAGDVLVGARDNGACRAKHSVHMACVASPAARQALSQGGCFVCRASLVHLVPLVVPTPFVGSGLAFSPWPGDKSAQGLLSAADTWNIGLVQLARANPDGEWGFRRTVDLCDLLAWGEHMKCTSQPNSPGKIPASTLQFTKSACSDALAVSRSSGPASRGGAASAAGGGWPSLATDAPPPSSSAAGDLHTTGGVAWSTGSLLVRSASSMLAENLPPWLGGGVGARDAHLDEASQGGGVEVLLDAAWAQAAATRHWCENHAAE